MIPLNQITSTVASTIKSHTYIKTNTISDPIDYQYYTIRDTIDYQYYTGNNLGFAPRHIFGNLDCYNNKDLTSLDNFPEYVGGHFYCFGASNLPYSELFKIVDNVKGEIFYSSDNVPEDKDKIKRDRDVNSILKDDELGSIDV